MADSLVWHLIRDNNSFLVKRARTARDGEVQFSKEPGNLMGVNTFKYSGIANSKTIDIASSSKKSGDKTIPTVGLTVKTGKDANKPKASVTKKNVKNAAEIAELTKGYRSDLTAAAKVRYAKVYRASTLAKGIKSKKPKAKRGRGN
jgi:large subunit ribosomal protein L28e